MQYYLAPLEGITTFIYRQVFHHYYGHSVEKYFIPFIETHIRRDFNARELNDILPEHNEGMCAIPQVLTKDAAAYLLTEKSLLSFGYKEINLNIGCPSKTVTASGRGAGMLSDPLSLDHFLEEVFSRTNAEISIKTRLGIDDPEEFVHILEIYKKYPLKELIIHPRVQSQMYRGDVHLPSFSYALEHWSLPLCYNGDIISVARMKETKEKLDTSLFEEKCQAVMLGRGAISDPTLINHLNDISTDSSLFFLFHEELLDRYCDYLSGDRNVLFRMKDLWAFWKQRFPDSKKQIKAILKSQSVKAYRDAVSTLLSQSDN